MTKDVLERGRSRPRSRQGAARSPGAAQAARVRVPSWRDVRLLVGVLLILASVALGARVVTMAGHTDPFYVVAHELTPGDRLTTEDLRVVQLRLDSAAGAYLSAAQPLGEGLVVRRPVAAGEVLPLAAIGGMSDVGVRPVGIPVAHASDYLAKGAVVDVWVSHKDPDQPGAFTAPRRLAGSVTVADVQASGSGLGAGTGAVAHVLLGEADLPAVVDALANQDVILLVPGGGA